MFAYRETARNELSDSLRRGAKVLDTVEKLLLRSAGSLWAFPGKQRSRNFNGLPNRGWL